MKDGTHIHSGGIELIDSIESLWEELKAHHLGIDKVYPDGIAKADFQNRKTELIQKGNLHLIDLVETVEDGKIIGYCLSSITEKNIGEIDSIFIVPTYRKHGIGKELVQRALSWMDRHKVKANKVNVLQINNDAVNLYKQFGFVTRQLEMVIPKNHAIRPRIDHETPQAQNTSINPRA